MSDESGTGRDGPRYELDDLKVRFAMASLAESEPGAPVARADDGGDGRRCKVDGLTVLSCSYCHVLTFPHDACTAAIYARSDKSVCERIATALASRIPPTCRSLPYTPSALCSSYGRLVIRNLSRL